SPIVPGLTVTLPDLHFVPAGTQLTAAAGTTDPVTIPLGLAGRDTTLQPGAQVSESLSPVQTSVAVGQSGTLLSGMRFLLDTGAQMSAISVSLAQALGLDLAHPTTTVTLKGVGGEQTVPGYTIDELDLPRSDGGILQFTHVPVYVLSVDGLDGIL